jgi:hypothetical protein
MRFTRLTISNTLICMGLIDILEKGRQDFLDATNKISPEQAVSKPIPNGWSVTECVEHVAAVEDRFLGFILSGTEIEPKRDFEKEMRIFTTVRSRLTKLEAPEVVRPCGRFATLPAALAEFHAARDRSIQLVKERGDRLYAIGATHPRFGALNGAELIQMIDGHARRHADQIRELREAFPA